ncbi:APC family permease [Lactococcus fujiensis]|uniref:Amino acid permease n=1 Tax=Lactococcus fujiensis JCM 16395 TaxID=1291764 RepID=A0A2A5RKK2_9LACT|nr:APC family permease [Lactococcus fujiensis]PCR99773.1 amino acid permease [Lactococcus fujiensis JCM 16395]
MFKKFKEILIGKPLKSSADDSHLLNKMQALAMLSSDALSSVAYGPEQIILVLMTIGATAIWYSIPIAAVILLLLFALIMSYTQVIHAYPSGGGAYLVSTENLGTIPGLISGGSLLVDYMLTVAVSTASGADAITSAIPELYNYNLEIAIVLALILMFMNLRGLRESASFLMIPVYTFIISTFILLGVGIFRILSGSLPYQAPAHIGTSIAGVSLILILKAFSTGSSSLTGVEAISNAVPFFKRPKEHNAALTLVMMGSILAFFFAGVVFFAYWMGIVPQNNVTVIAQMAKGLLGSGPLGQLMFFIFQFSTALILAVAANTGYSAFPVLAFNMAKNKYMPHMFTARGDRLSYSNGIISLAAGAIVLLLIFKGETERLIPLYAIGVFTPFTLAQVGMVIHWKKRLGKQFIWHSIPNILGALISFAVVMILLIFRTAEIWPFFIVLPVLIFAFIRVHHHYVNVAEQLRLREGHAEHKFDGNTVIVLVGNVTNVDLGAINYARSIGEYVIALHVSTKENTRKEQEIESEFEAAFPDLHLTVIRTNYRDIIAPAVRYISLASKNAKKRNYTTTVIIPNFIPSKPWENMFHNQTGLRLRVALNSHEDIILASYNYHLKK